MTNIQEILSEILEVQESLNTDSIAAIIDYVEALLDSDKKSLALAKRGKIKFSKSKRTDLERQLIDKWLTELDVFVFDSPGLYNRDKYYSFKDLEDLEVIRLSEDKTVFLAINISLEGRFIIPNSIKKLGDAAFEDSKLSEIILPDDIKVIPEDCFAYCKNLKEIKFGDNIKSIGMCAFAFSGIEKIYIPEDAYISTLAFRGCENLKRDVVPDFCEV